MTPPAARAYYPRDTEPARADTQHSLKGETVKYLISMLVAGLTAYFAALYGIKEEVAVLKVRLEYLQKETDKQTRAIDSLTASINAHTLAHEEAARQRGGRRP